MVAGYFDDQLFAGYVTLHYPADGTQLADLWHIEYEDGDEEDMTYEEVIEGMKRVADLPT